MDNVRSSLSLRTKTADMLLLGSTPAEDKDGAHCDKVGFAVH